MLLSLQRCDFELVYQPGSQMILVDTLPRAFSPTATATNFPDEVSTLSTIDAEEQPDFQMVASADSLALIESVAGDNEYIRQQQQISRG